MLDQRTVKKRIYDFDPLAPAQGAFGSLNSRLKDVSVSRGGDGFAISAKFPYLSYCQAIEEQYKYASLRSSNPQKEIDNTSYEIVENSYNQLASRYNENSFRDILLYPSPESASTSSLNPSAGIGGLVHEVGHVIYDMAGEFARPSVVHSKIGKALDLYIKKPVAMKNLHRWTNLCADIRLERWLVREYPNTSVRLRAVQQWVYGLEREVREDNTRRSFGSHVQMYLRDVGKGHYDSNYTKTVAEYNPQAVMIVESLRPIWEQLIPKEGDTVESTVHLPLKVALELIHALNNNDFDEGEGQGGGNDQGEGDEQGEGNGQGDGNDEDQG